MVQPFTINDVIANRFQVLEQVGRGGYSYVYKAIDIKSKQLVAIKQFIFNEDKEDVELIRREA